MSIYRVTGQRAYRGHQPGETFEANLDERAEYRAIRRGSIELVTKSKPALNPGSYKLPKRPQAKRGTKKRG